MLLNKCSTAPVTALAFLDNFVIAGEGSLLKIYCCTSSKCILHKRVFEDQTVHGIVLSDDNVGARLILIWGGTFSRVIALCWEDYQKTNSLSFSLSPLLECSDWILHGAFQPGQTTSVSKKAALVTAHNKLLGVNIIVKSNNKSQSRIIETCLERLSKATRCVLYTAHIHWVSPKHILIASGTAFGEIIVWSCFGDESTSRTTFGSLRKITHYDFPAHDGSVFGIDIHRNVNFPAIKSPRLVVASCSDDRTINAWDISSVLDVFEADDLRSDLNNIRQSPEIRKDAPFEIPRCAPTCLVKIWAHKSRIWQIASLGPGAEQSRMMRLISGGEDAACQMWELVGEPVDGGEARLTINHLSTFMNHAGKNIWSIASFESNFTKIATGGADGGITMLVIKNRNKFGTDTINKEWEYSDIYDNKISATDHNVRPPELAVSITENNPALILTGSSETIRQSSHPESFYQHQGCLRPSPTGLADITLISNSSETRNSALVPRDNSSKDKNVSKLHSITDSIKAYKLVSHNSWMLVTRQGQIWSEHLGSPLETRVTSKFVTQIDDLRGCSITAAVPSLRLCFLASSGGKIYRYSDMSSDITVIAEFAGKITGLFAQRVEAARTETVERNSAAPQSGDEHIALLVSTAAPSELHLYISKYAELELYKEPVTIGLSHGDIATSMLYVLIPDQENLLFVGFRGGKVAKYLEVAAKHSYTVPLVAQTVHQAHQEDAVTSMIWHPEVRTPTGSDGGFLLTTGRDSTYAIHHFKNPISAPFVHPTLVHRSSLPFGPNVEGAFVRESDGHLILYGFRSKHFIVYDETEHKDFMTVKCGGAHRIWNFHHDDGSKSQEGGTFIWTQASHLAIKSWSSSQCHVVKRGGHGREIKACAVRPSSSSDGISSRLIVTGAEDTDIRLFECLYAASKGPSPGFRCVGIIRKHNTGLQQLRWSSDGRYLFSSGGSEEFFVWRIRNVPFVHIGIVCESSLPAISELQDLRITAFDIIEEGSVRPKPEDPLEEAEAECFKITMVFSDSTLRVYRYTTSLTCQQWHLLHHGKYTTCCLTQVHLLATPTMSKPDCTIDPDGPPCNLLTASTDGHLAIWPLHQFPHPTIYQNPPHPPTTISHTQRIRIHQSTIKFLAVIPLSPPTFRTTISTTTTLLITTGDDNALAFTLFSLSLSPSHSLPHINHSTLSLPRAHAAAITALVILPPSNPPHTPRSPPTSDSPQNTETTLRIVTASNDQTLKIWDVDVDLSLPGVQGVQVRRVQSVYCGVADVAAMDLWVDETAEEGKLQGQRQVEVVVCGVGMDVWSVPARE